MALTKKDVALAVLKLGDHGRCFKFPDLRNALRVKPSSRDSSELFNCLTEMVREGLVEVVPDGDKKRYKSYRVKNEERLRSLASLLIVPPSGDTRVVDTLIRIEERLGHIEALLS